MHSSIYICENDDKEDQCTFLIVRILYSMFVQRPQIALGRSSKRKSSVKTIRPVTTPKPTGALGRLEVRGVSRDTPSLGFPGLRLRGGEGLYILSQGLRMFDLATQNPNSGKN